MKWAIFRKSIRDSWKGMFGWGIGLGLYALLVIGLYPSVAEQKADFEKIMDNYPDSMTAIMGTDDLFSPVGYLQSQLMLYLPLLLGIYAILQGLNAVTGEERKQTMDTLAALPIPRWQILTEKFLATLVIMVGILTQFFLSLVIGRMLWPELDISYDKLAAVTYASLLPIMVIAGVAFLLSAVLPMHRRWGGIISSLFLVGTYLIYALGNASKTIEPFQPFTPFEYYNTIKILEGGLPLGDILVLTVAILLLWAASLYTFERRDLGT
ncbi:MAG: ABC transporter permease subunit [Chloroflexi bacterium]|nr:ABC transporter permease subunit [Chloroflexota bacterium]